MSKRRFNSTQDAEILRRYEAGESSESIAKNILPGEHVDGLTVRNTLRRLGVELRKAAHETNPTITQEQRDRAVVLCRDEGYTLQEAADAVGISKETVFRSTQAAGVALTPGKPRTREVNDAAFDVLTPESLYWIGFLFADGNVHQDVIKTLRKSRATAGSPALNVGLSAVDRGHLEKLRSFLGSTHAIGERNPRDSMPAKNDGLPVKTGAAVYLSVRSRPICEALTRYGMVTKAARLPVAEVASSRDFWRGMVDGDGSVGTSREYPSIRLAGQQSLVDMFTTYLRHEGLANLQSYPGDQVWMVGTTGRPALAIIRKLYDGATVSLDRKQRVVGYLLSNSHGS